MNEYRSGGTSLFHLDLYRVNCFEEVIDIGLFEILQTGNPCLVEWAERVAELQKLPHLEVCIEQPDPESEFDRLISWTWKEP
jgi:tRNA threonylcarbamoyladenosine biosynthesis protein TsaE